MKIKVDENLTLLEILKGRKPFLPIKDLAKKYKFNKIWLKNKLNVGVKEAKIEIKYFEYDGTHYWREDEFLKWYKRNYLKGEGKL